MCFKASGVELRLRYSATLSLLGVRVPEDEEETAMESGLVGMGAATESAGVGMGCG